ncbi:DUF6507 family protein [Streptomyces sp. NBC_01363]|uniref:DUF6507 family protein n=1 Tax=Streptomyces sp. NBC_01363 TaxID=2903840 RepID=UPI0022507DB7|nr:DUF6507 family protein [Streptomyces sp. NBC_01363]MCX4732064.1 DUF6507 family protein [Streptomyces sp. NBC_01363]
MVAWDIRPQGVQGQLRVVGVHAGDLEKALTALMATVSEAAQAAGTAVPGAQAVTHLQGPVAAGQAPLSRQAMGPVAAALGEYLGERKKDLKAAAERIEASVLGAVEATNTYCEGDLETARHAQDAAKAVRLDVLKGMQGHR